MKNKKRKVNPASKGVDPKRGPKYDRGGRAPGTKEAVIPVTTLLDRELFEELKELSEKFISPKTIRPYGMAAIVRYCVELGLEGIGEISEKDLLYYVPKGVKGEVGRRGVAEETVKSTFPIHKRSIKAINKHLASLDNSIIGTTTYVRMFLRQHLGEVTLRNLYSTIPDSHKDLMADNGWTPRHLRVMYSELK